ncbi:cysteine hydrolase family protein [Paenibacillus sp.]|uniref:cysteine hydrolase family protein n=1 Tax=Paenibacillus sp. TaxID=58172 RepID=UPI002D3C9821|nr:cysteine hydrolase family protein [Paenibacillus sp.]HZG57249.1 cysteine hydrolase family protein [Paenibacillus sp.]
MERLPTNAPLLIIDVQKAFDHPKWGNRNNPDAERNIAALLRAWRKTGRPVIFVQHASPKETSVFYPDSEWFPFKEEVAPLESEPVIRKTVNSAFIGTNLEAMLLDMGVSEIVITGITTNQCVETTTRMAENLGFRPILVSDAAATFDKVGPDGNVYRAEDIHRMTLVNLHEVFATVLDTEAVLARL